MKTSSAKVVLPVDVNAVRLTVGALTPADLDNYGFQMLAAGAFVFAPHDGLFTDNAGQGQAVITAKNGKYGSRLFGFAVAPELAGAKDKPVKKGDKIGATVAPDALLTWSAFVRRPTKDNPKETMAIHPLLLAGALGGIEYTGLTGAQGWADDMQKGLTGLFSTIGSHAAAFGVGWLIGKA